MSANDLLGFLTQTLFVVVFLVVVKAVRQPRRATVDMALLFGVASLLVAEGWAAPLLHLRTNPLLVATSSGLIMALPYLLVRLVDDFAHVPRPVLYGALVGLGIAVASFFIVPPRARPLGLTLLYVAYFVGLTVYTGVALQGGVGLAGREIVEDDIHTPPLLVRAQFRERLTDEGGGSYLVSGQRLAAQAREGEKIVDQAAHLLRIVAQQVEVALGVRAMTANAMAGDDQACLAAGMDAYIPKPVTRAQLDAVLAQWQKRATPAAPGDAFAGAPADGDVLDSGALTALRDLQDEGESDVLAAVIEDYLRDTPLRVAALHEALARADAGAVRREAHGIKGSSGYLGAVEMTRLCADLEGQARAGDLTQAPKLVHAIAAAFERVRAHLGALPAAGDGS
jgi:HPt (histidine-containing phosphotransfer) domain-containing protein